MRNVDCEWLVNESHNCCHKKRKTLLSKLGLWSPTCLEYRFEEVDCKYRESIWDMLKKNEKIVNHQKPTSRPPPPPPPAPPPTRTMGCFGPAPKHDELLTKKYKK